MKCFIIGRNHDGQKPAAGCELSPRNMVSRLIKYLRSRRSTIVPVVQVSARAGAGAGGRRISRHQQTAAPVPTPAPLLVNGRINYDNMTPATRLLVRALAHCRRRNLERLEREEAEMTRSPDVVSVAGSFRGEEEEDEDEDEEFVQVMDHFKVE